MAALMLSTMTAFAQNEVGQFTIQPKIGLNVTNFLGDDWDSADSRCGLAVGAEVEYGAADIVGISAGVLYSMQGVKYDNATAKVDYINIPILCNVYVVKGLAVKLGIQPGFNVNSSVKFKQNGVSTEGDVDAKTVDFSIPVGVSYQYQNFVLDARYNWGLTKIFDATDAKNSVFQITLGYKFAL